MNILEFNKIDNTISIFKFKLHPFTRVKKNFTFGYSPTDQCFYKVDDNKKVDIILFPDCSAYEIGVLVNNKWQFMDWTEYTDLGDNKKLLQDKYVSLIFLESGKTNRVTVIGKQYRRAPEWIKPYWLKRLYTCLFKSSEKVIDITFKKSINKIYGLPGEFTNSLQDSWKKFEKEVLPKLEDGTY